jgi:photosystem II stability/assembly factor-like uncharacterized protein
MSCGDGTAMAMRERCGMRVLVGTVGQSVLATDDGEHWGRLGPINGFHSDAIVRTLINAPDAPNVIWAGTDQGILRSDDGGRSWSRLEGPLARQQVWRISLHPSQSNVVFVGTGTPSSARMFRSEDRGATWTQLDVEIAEECPAVGVPRVTDIAIDPLEPTRMWASIEVDGMRQSTDGGQTWRRIEGPITKLQAGCPQQRRAPYVGCDRQAVRMGQRGNPARLRQPADHGHVRLQDVGGALLDDVPKGEARGSLSPVATGIGTRRRTSASPGRSSSASTGSSNQVSSSSRADSPSRTARSAVNAPCASIMSCTSGSSAPASGIWSRARAWWSSAGGG